MRYHEAYEAYEDMRHHEAYEDMRHHEGPIDLDGWSLHLPHHRAAGAAATWTWRGRARGELRGLPGAADAAADAAVHDWWLRHV